MRKILLFFASGWMLASGVSAQSPPSGLLFARFESYLEALRLQAGIPGMAAAIVGESEIVRERTFGVSNVGSSIATDPNTPFHLDGLTQLFTAAVVLRCVEEGRVSLDDPINRYTLGTSDGNATLRQILSHSSPAPGGLLYAYRPERLEWLQPVIRACTGDSFRETVANLLERLAMYDSVPGRDVVALAPPAEGIPAPEAAERYSLVLERLATSYAVAGPGQATPSPHPDVTLGAAGGLISTLRDMTEFDLALKNELIVMPETLSLAWSEPPGRGTQPLPHGLGWFVQIYKGELVVWQFGLSENASSSLLVSVPSRQLTMILLANSDGLAKPFPLQAGDVLVSPFARVFLGLVLP